MTTLLPEQRPPTCEICNLPHSDGQSDCHSCGRRFHTGSCGGTYRWSEIDTPDFDPDEAFRSKFLPGYNDRPPRGSVVTKELCIVCRLNDFGRHGVPPGEKQWRNALEVYRQGRRKNETVQVVFQRRNEEVRKREAERKLREARAQLERLEWFCRYRLAEIDFSRKNLEDRLKEALEDAARLEDLASLLQKEAHAAAEERDGLAAQWSQLNSDRRRNLGRCSDEHQTEVAEIERRGQAAAKRRDQARLDAETASNSVLRLQDETRRLKTAINDLCREESLVTGELQQAAAQLEELNRNSHPQDVEACSQ